MSATKKRILIVDDEPAILRFLTIQLRVSGYEVVSTTKGTKALELVRTQRPDVVLLDILMPDMNGLDVLQKIRQVSRVPVIAFTASREFAAKAIELGAVDSIDKPFAPDALLARVKAVLDNTEG